MPLWFRQRRVRPTDAKQGTGPRSMLLVLVVSLVLAVLAGLVLYGAFFGLPSNG